MTISYHSGERIQATSADFAGTPAISGGWKEVGRTTAGSTITELDVTGFDDKRYYMVLGNLLHNGSQDVTMRCGQSSTLDTGSNYASRRSENGGSDAISHTRPNMILADIQSSTQSFGVNYFSNKSTKEKLQLGHMVYQGTAGAGNAPDRTETANKWANTSNALDSLSYDQGSWLSGSEMVVLGWDEDDTHTTNFWEELASVNLSGGASDDLSSGTISAKKYLWVQAWLDDTGGNINNGFRFNSDTGSNYSTRRSVNGATDATQTSKTATCDDATDASYPRFYNMFIINNSANEKLCICHMNGQNTSGAGTATIRGEYVGKWDNTSAQITNITARNFGVGSLGTNSIMKVWGSN